jgi:hypothetical protein
MTRESLAARLGLERSEKGGAYFLGDTEEVVIWSAAVDRWYFEHSPSAKRYTTEDDVLRAYADAKRTVP